MGDTCDKPPQLQDIGHAITTLTKVNNLKSITRHWQILPLEAQREIIRLANFKKGIRIKTRQTESEYLQIYPNAKCVICDHARQMSCCVFVVLMFT